jgi:hypothetical protein
MSATVYKNVNYQGVYAQLHPGFYSGRDLVGCPHQSTSCEDLDNAINSIRVDPNVIVAFADSHAISASGGGARVLIGPAEVSDLTALGMSNRISSVLVVPFRAYDSAIPAPDGGVTLYDSYSMTGRRSLLRRGDYPPARLTSEEVKLPGPQVTSLSVAAGVIVVLYSGPNFETTADAVMVVGPTVVEDLDRVGMSGRVRSIRVLYSDPFDVPGRPTLGLGSARAYTPGGALGLAWPSRAALGAAPRPTALTGALDLLMSGDSNPSPSAAWASGAAPLPILAPPQVIYVQAESSKDHHAPHWMVFALIAVFMVVIALAAYLAARSSRNKIERRSSEATLLAQAAVPLAVTAALI